MCRIIGVAVGLIAVLAACKPSGAADTDTGGTTAAPTEGSSDGASSSGTPTSGGDCGDVIEGDLVVTDATDAAALACVVEVKGALHVDDTTTWTDLMALAELRRVGGNITIHRNAGLVSLDGLQQLEHVDGSVGVLQNPKLADISGLSGLRQLAGLGVVENAVTVFDALQGDVTFVSPMGGLVGLNIHEELLTDLDGLAALGEVMAPDGLSIYLFEMPALEDVSALAVFASIAGPLDIAMVELPALPSFAWPGPLERLHIHDAAILHELKLPAVVDSRAIVLSALPALTTLSGLATVETVVEALRLGPCDAPGLGVTDLDGLESLTQVGRLVVANNPSLLELTGLPIGLKADEALFRGNTQLPQAAAEAWLESAGIGSSPESGACGNLDGPACSACPVRR